MAKYREPEYCPNCNQPLKGVHRDMGKNFVGDTFIRYELCNCTQSEVKEPKQAEENIGMTVEEFYSGFNLDFMTEEERQTIYTATELYAKGKMRTRPGEPGGLQDETFLHYFREGYKYHRSFSEKVPYDEASEITVKKGFEQTRKQ